MTEPKFAFEIKDLEKGLARLQKDVDEQKAEREKLRDKVERLETTRIVLITVAAIFGIAGAWGASILQSVQNRLATAQGQVADLQQKGTQPIIDAERKAVADAISEISNAKEAQVEALNQQTSEAIEQGKSQVTATASQFSNEIRLIPQMKMRINALSAATDYLYSSASSARTFRNDPGEKPLDWLSHVVAKSTEVHQTLTQ